MVNKKVKIKIDHMKVLYVLNNYPPNIIGGAEIIGHRHLKLLNDQGFECEAFAGDHTLQKNPYTVSEDIFEEIRTTRVSLGPGQSDWKNENFFDSKIDSIFKNTLNRFKPDIVHFHNLPGLSVNLILIAKKAGAFTFLTVHDHWGFCHRQTLTKPDKSVCKEFSECEKCQPFYIDKNGQKTNIKVRNDFIKQSFFHLDLLISPSYYLLDQYKKAQFTPTNTAVISYGVDLLQFNSNKAKKLSNSAAVTFGFAGHLSAHKGVRHLLDAISILPQDIPCRFLFTGDGPMKKDLEEYKKSHANGHLIYYVGSTDPNKMSAFYNELQVLINASQWPENQPLTIMEAMASGNAIIASDCGGNRELVHSHITGLLTEINNVSSITEGIMFYIKHREKISQHAAAASRYISLHSIKKSILKLTNMYYKHRHKKLAIA